MGLTLDLQPVSPPMLDHVITACLAKNPEDRCQSAADLMRELKWVVQTPSAGERTSAPSSKGTSLFWMTATAALLTFAAAVSWIHFREATSFQPTLHYTIPLPREGESEGLYFQFHLSPNGQLVAVSGVIEQVGGIFVRELDSLEWRPLSGTTVNDFFWSPDSRHIAFFDDQGLRRVSVGGGPTEVIAAVSPLSPFWASGSWSRNEMIVIDTGSGGPVLSVPATGGELRAVTTAQSGVDHRWPTFLPDGQHFLYSSQGGSSPGIHVASLDNSDGQRLLADSSSALFAPGAEAVQVGHIIFIREGKLMAQPFDSRALEFQGDAFVIAERAEIVNNLAAAVSTSTTGSSRTTAGETAKPAAASSG